MDLSALVIQVKDTSLSNTISTTSFNYRRSYKLKVFCICILWSYFPLWVCICFNTILFTQKSVMSPSIPPCKGDDSVISREITLISPWIPTCKGDNSVICREITLLYVNTEYISIHRPHIVLDSCKPQTRSYKYTSWFEMFQTVFVTI